MWVRQSDTDKFGIHSGLYLVYYQALILFRSSPLPTDFAEEAINLVSGLMPRKHTELTFGHEQFTAFV